MNRKNMTIGIIIAVLLLGVIGLFVYSIDDNRVITNNETDILDDDKTTTSGEDDILNDDSDNVDKNDNNYNNDNSDNNNDNDNEIDEDLEEDSNSGGIHDSKDNDGSNNKREIKYVNKFPRDGYCAQAIDEFYKKNGVTYYFTCQMSQYIYVVIDGVEYGLVEALENNIVTIEEVEKAKGSKFLSKSNNLYSY